MKIRLDTFGESVVKKLMPWGHWPSPSNLINDGLRVVRERHVLWNGQRREFVHGLLLPALKEFNRGNVVAYASDILDQLKTKKPYQVGAVPLATTARGNRQFLLSRLALRDLRYYWKSACAL